MWPFSYMPFYGLNSGAIDSVEFKYTKFDYITWFFLISKDVPNYVPGYFEFRFKDIKAYKLK